MNKRWKLKPAGDEEVIKKLSVELNINKILASLLVQRGIDNYDKAKSFFRPSLNDLHDPFLMKNMDKAIDRIDKALQNNEHIMIFGDYDVDGTTAVAMVYSFFLKIHKQITYYIPDRNEEGYGVSYKGIDFAADNDISLIIALDCGIKDVEKIKYAKNKNIDFIVCDHHQPGNDLPEAIAVLDPKQDDCNYPFKELCGCGVGFKLLQAFTIKHDIHFDELEKYLDLVAVSTAADIVPIIGENRIFVYYGLKKINAAPRIGLEALLKCSGINRKDESVNSANETIFAKPLVVRDLVFVISPRINAAGRIEYGDKAVELLVCNDSVKALELAKSIEENNTQRKNLDEQTVIEALEMIQNDPKLLNSKATVVYNPGWHKGVVGIAASRLIETYYRPTIVFTKTKDLITGSARSVKGFDIYTAIDSCSDLLENFGGHKYAAGLSLKPENFEAFRNRFNEIVSSTIDDEMLIPEQEIDTTLDFKDISENFYDILKQFAPFGPGNMSPVFQTNGVIDKGFAKVLKEKHLKLFVAQPNSEKKYFDAIAFNHCIHYENITNEKPFNICYHIEENEWNGKKKLQLRIKGIAYN